MGSRRYQIDLSVPMTLSDIKRRNARGPVFFHVISIGTLVTGSV